MPAWLPDWAVRWLSFAAVGAALFGFGFLKGCEHGEQAHKNYLVAMEQANADLLARINKRNAEAAAKWQAFAKSQDESYAKQIADIRARANAGGSLRLFDPGQSGRSACSAEKGNPGVSETGTAAGRISDEAGAFLLGQANLADEVATYAKAAREVALRCLAESGK